MSLKTRFLLAALLIVLAALLAMWFSPTAISNGVRWWAWWKASQEGLVVTIDKIDAPFLQPVVIRGFRVASLPRNAFRIDLTVTQATLDLNFERILLHTRGHAIRTLSIQGLRGELRHSNPPGHAITQRGWVTLQKLLPQNLSIASSDVRLENAPTVILLRNTLLSASETEAGRFTAAEAIIASPWFRQTFSNLRGATNWQDNRLTLAGLALTRGLDLQAITADLSHLGEQRIGLEFDADAFGGKIRAKISHQWRSERSNWKLAGSASDISLAQTSEALGFTDRVDGLLHACNFTFRGNLADPGRATASLWTELTGLSWRNRTAEAIMFGAALYNRQVQLQQLYIKQKTNQLTLSGEASFPSNSSDWLSPDFRGDISAAINQLGDFVALFGANPGDFAGKLAIEGILNTRARKLTGDLTIEGTSLILLKTAIDSLRAKLKLEGTQLAVEQFDLKRKSDYLNAQGKIDLTYPHGYSGTLKASVSDLTDYFGMFSETGPPRSPFPATAQFTVNSGVWNGYAAITTQPNSWPITFAAVSLPLRIGESWTEFSMTPLQISLSFGDLSLEKAPPWLGLSIFRSGVLRGGLQVYGTLQRPSIDGEVELIDAKTKDEALGFTEISGRLRIGEKHGLIDFLRVSNKDVDLSFGGDVAVRDIDDVTITLTSNLPMFDVTSDPLQCVKGVMVSRIDTLLAPIISEIELGGGFIGHNWTITLRPSPRQLAEPMNLADRTIPLCVGAWPNQGTLLLGALPRPEAHREMVPSKKRTKRR